MKKNSWFKAVEKEIWKILGVIANNWTFLEL